MSKTVQEEMAHARGGEGADDADVTDLGAVSAMPDRPPLRKLAVVLAALAIVVVAVVIGLVQMFKLVSDEKLAQQTLGVANEQLAAIESRDREFQTSWGVVDEEKGCYHMPIDRAMERLLAHPELLKPLAEPPRPSETGAATGGAGSPGAKPASDGEEKPTK